MNDPLKDPATLHAMRLGRGLTDSPARRLEQSRERMRESMLHLSGRPPHGPGEAGSAEESGWLDSLRSHPLAALLMGAMGGWWQSHPLNSAARAGQGGAASRMLSPWARRHPVALVLGAVVVGGLLVRTRPWRWLAKPALVTGVLSYALRSVVSHIPVRSLLGLLSGFSSPAAAQPVPEEPPEKMSKPRGLAAARRSQPNGELHR
jgi:hypothetical protein